MRRRDFIGGIFLAPLLPGMLTSRRSWARSHRPGSRYLAFYLFDVGIPGPSSKAQGFVEGHDAPQAVLVSLSDGEPIRIPLSVRPPHSILNLDPPRTSAALPTLALCLPKGTRLAQVVNWQKVRVEKDVIAPDGLVFYGHGAVIPSRKEIFLTAYDGNLIGQIVRYRLSDFSLVGSFPSYGVAPHDLKYAAKDDLVIIANNGTDGVRGGEPESSVSYVSARTMRLVDKVKVPVQGLLAQHLDMAGSDRVFVAMDQAPGFRGTLPLAGLIESRRSFKSFSFDQYGILKKNTLSVAMSPDLSFGMTTTPEGASVLWDLRSAQAIAAIPKMKYPHGVVFDPDAVRFVVSTSQDGFWQVSPKEPSVAKALVKLGTFRNVAGHLILI